MYGKIDILELAKFGNLEFLAKQVVEGFITGLHRSPFHGFSVEFAEHRLYNKGESTKYIDWKLFARTDKLFVKRFEEETNLRCRFVLDCSSSMYFPKINSAHTINKLGFSIYAIASLIELIKRQRDGVGLSAFNDHVLTETAIKTSNTHIKRIYAELEKLMTEQSDSLNRKTDFTNVLHEVAENTHKRSLVIIFSDFFSNQSLEDVADAFLHLKHNKHEVILFNVLDRSKEVKFDFPQQPTSFVDLESGEKIKLHPSEIKKSYQDKVSSYLQALKLKCSQFKIDFVEIDINEPIEFALQQYLIKRSKII
ncbi:MAG: DUF58 domain-containing protein [Putridiphycobacter sp.]